MEDRYRQYFDEMPCYVSVQDPHLLVLDANLRFREDFGDFQGQHCFVLYKNRKEKCPECPVERTFQDGKNHGGEQVVLRRDGNEVAVRVHTRPILDESGKVVAVLEMLTDIADSRWIQARFSSLNLLTGTISHAIRGQLTGLDGGIYMMNSGHARNDPERVKKGLAMVQRNVERIRNLVLNILYYAKDREPLWSPVSAPELVKDLEEAVRKKAEESDVAFSAEVAAGVGEFEADPKAVQSLLASILENSFEACGTDPEKKKHWVRLSVSQDSGNMIFKVQDNGRGLDPETREKVRSPLFLTKIEGAALGLYIVNKIVTAHGGSFQIDSAPKEGATLTVRLPKKRPGKEQGKAAETPAAKA